MYGSAQGSTRSGTYRGPEIYYGYCARSGRYRMMDLSDYMSSMQEGMSRMQEGMSRLMNDTAAAYQDMLQTYSGGTGGATYTRRPTDDRCGCRHHCDDCHCECCVCDADVLVHARCGEIRRIPVTFENDTRREKPVKLELGKFVSAGGRDLQWTAALSETEFTLRPCGEHTVFLLVRVICPQKTDTGRQPTTPAPGTPAPPTGAAPTRGTDLEGGQVTDRFGVVDRCEVGYATIRAEGCLTRPVVVAVAVLPDDCDTYRHPCGCGCCD